MAVWARKVERSDLFRQSYEDLAPQVERLPSIVRGIEWTVGTAPEEYTKVPDTKLWLITTDPYPGAPAVAVYYTIEPDDSVCLRWIELAP